MKDKKIKVIHIIDHLRAGGAQSLLVNLAKCIDKERYNIAIVILKDNNIYSTILKKHGVVVYCVSSSRYSIGINRLAAILQKECPDIVHTHLLKANILGQYAAKKLQLPRIAHIHHMLNPQALLAYFFQSNILSKIYLFFLRLVLKGAVRTITTNKVDKKFLIECWGFQPAQVLYMPNGVSFEMFTNTRKDRIKYRKKVRAMVGIKEEPIVIGMVGRFSIEKNWPLFFITAALIKKKLPESIFWAVGDGKELTSCKKLAKSLGLESSVHFWGYQNNISEIYCGMDCFLFTSILDSFPLVLMEVMLAKVPVVAVNSEAANTIITHMKNALLVDSLNPEAIATAMVNLLQDKNLQTRITAQGYENCSKKFNVIHWVDSMASLYTELGCLYPSPLSRPKITKVKV